MSDAHQDRRRHPRFPLGLPVGVRLAGDDTPVIFELLDISESGARFQASSQTSSGEVAVAQRATFGFVLADRGHCHAKGEVVRVERSGQFVLALDDIDDSFIGFIHRLEGNS